MVLAATYNPTMEGQEVDKKDGLFSISPFENDNESLLDDNKKEQYVLVYDFIKKNQLEKADQKVTDLLVQYPDDTRFINLNALLKMMQQDEPAAKKNYQKVLKLDPNNLTAILGLAKLNLSDENFVQARNFADKALNINEKSLGAYLILAKAAEKQEKKGDAEKILLNGLNKVTGNVETEAKMVRTLGSLYVSEKQTEKLLPIAHDLIKRYPGNNIALSVLASAQLLNKQYQLAEQTLKQIIRQDPKDINHRLLLANLISKAPNKEEEALIVLNEVLQIEPNNPEALLFKAEFQTKQKQYQPALATIDVFDELYPQQAITKQLTGDVFLAEKKYAKALEYYQQAYQMKPTTEMMFLLVDLMVFQKKEVAAIELLNNELKKNNKNSAAHFKLAGIYQQLKDHKQAEAHYESVLAEQKDNVLALNNLAWLYYQQNNPEALGLAKRAYEKAPGSPSIADTYGTILIKQGDKKQGLAIIKKAAIAKPESHDIQYHLALAYSVNGNNKQAIEILQRIEQSEQYFSEKKSAIELLKKLDGT